jgi:hypothetical protein
MYRPNAAPCAALLGWVTKEKNEVIEVRTLSRTVLGLFVRGIGASVHILSQKFDSLLTGRAQDYRLQKL